MAWNITALLVIAAYILLAVIFSKFKKKRHGPEKNYGAGEESDAVGDVGGGYSSDIHECE